ncbi:MAG TPA: class I SAM-dependent methyltransferase [Pseudonocardiaceae bacterium]|nr:class I SAM-dependent methyltransferase [Pseudonocardiaceae bacterium]
MNPGQRAVFDEVLTGRPARLVGDDGRVRPVAAQRWLAPAGGEDDWLLDRCTGPTVDVGCGPGRLVAELATRGVSALGVDCSPSAVRQCHSRGAAVLHRDAFATLPREGRWHHVLLADGNIGIGGDPVRLLRRCTALLRPGGTMLVEAEHPEAVLWRGVARLQVAGSAAGPWFPWAVAGLQALTALAGQAGLQAGDRHSGRRCFLELRRPVGLPRPPDAPSTDGNPQPAAGDLRSPP